MDNPAFIILFAILFLFSIYIGFLTGEGICDRQVVTTRDYWVWNIGGIVLAVVLSVFLSALPLLYAALFGMLAGYIAGMRMSFDESVGPWKALDRFLKREPGKGKAKPATASTRADARRRRKAGDRGPDLISVENTAANGSTSKQNSKPSK